MKRWGFLLVAIMALLLAFHSSTRAGEIGWIEEYSLATDRSVPLKQLIPGTEDYYYYNCLYNESQGQWAQVDELLKAWVARYNWTPRAIEIDNRRALLTYDKDPKRTLDLIRNRLNLQFNHEREPLNQKPNLPLKMDPALISRERLEKQAFGQFPNTVQGFEDSALDWLTQATLNPEQRRHLLARMQRPDYPNLVKMVIDDLNYQNSGGFGQFNIHRLLLLSQLDECLKLKPDLKNQANFVNAYLVKLRPSDDVNWRQDPTALRDYLERLWAYVKTLDPVHNSLKAHVLYHRLLLDRQQGKLDPERFLEYIKLPKNCSYVEPKFMEPVERRQHAANLQQDFNAVTMLPAVGDDEPLVRSYLEAFFVDAKDYTIYTPYIQDQYLKRVFAETKIVNGLGDSEKLYSMMQPETYKQLKERIDLDFAYTNKTDLGADEAVSLDLFVKNVDTLIVKVFELNTQNFYRQNLKEIGPDIQLDGLVANEEKTYTYKEPALRRMKRTFTFPSLTKRGVYVIDFIGNGKASRALIRKGKLRFVTRTSLAGQEFTIFDETNTQVTDASLWLAGTLFQPDKDGTIVTPFSNQPGRQPVVISQGKFSSLGYFQQEAENYNLSAAMYVDREELIGRRKAQLIVRPRLTLNGMPVSHKALEEVRLQITSTDLDNIPSTKEVPDFKLYDDRETEYTFQVPQRLAKIQFVLRAKIQVESRNQKIDLAASHEFSLNEIDRSDKTQTLFFSRVGENYVVELLGKTGESKADRAVNFTLKMRDFTQPVYFSLQTNDQGRMLLGPLPGVQTVTAVDGAGTSQSWPIRQDEHTYSSSINGEVGGTIQVPYMGTSQKPDRAELSLLEMRGDSFVTDRFENLSIKDGLIKIEKLPVGDFSLWIKPNSTHIHIRVTAGKRLNQYVLGDYRKLEIRNPKPLQLQTVTVGEKTVKIQLENATGRARVHVFATRFQPAYPAYGVLSAIRPLEPGMLITPKGESQYVAGRSIGDEYRYIIDRKFARKYPGNMLERPQLLLNPWAIRNTETIQQQAQAGEQFFGEAKGGDAMAKSQAAGGIATGALADFNDLDFLATSSLVMANLEADAGGVVELKREELGPHQELLFVAVDPQNTVSRIVSLSDDKNDFLDLRLARTLDVKQHYMQQKLISYVGAGESLVVPDISSTRFESYDTLSKVFSLYLALNNDPKLAEFSFLRNWPSLKPEEKQALYLKYASHELHLFLYKKDPEFFKKPVKPYLANKKEKKFIDHYLIDADLSDYAKPWNFEQLNTLERVLLGQRLKGEQDQVSRLIKEQVEMLPPDQERFNHLFQTAIKGSSLDTDDGLGIRQAQDAQKEVKKLAEMEKRREPQDQLNLRGALADAPAPVVPASPPPPGAGPSGGGANAAAAPKPAERPLARGAKKDEKAKAMDGKDATKEMLEELDGDDRDMLRDDRARRKTLQQYYRKLDKTMEWVESNYYKLPLEQQNANLITATKFWKDYSAQDPVKPFHSTNMAEATHNFPEMLTALALMDLPFKAGEHKTEFAGAKMTLKAGSAMIVYHEEIQPAAKVAEHTPILVSENFFRNGDRFRLENGEQIDKFVTEEFLIDVVYGCHIVVTNPSSSRKKVDVLLQVPAGAMPVANGQYTRSLHLDLEPYHTQTLEYYFYFPRSGKFDHYPVQVAGSKADGSGEVQAFGAAFMFNVVKELTNIDKQSWDYISQHGTADDVLAYLKKENVLRVNLDRIAWRMKDKAYFKTVTDLLAARHIYSNTLWSYGVMHDDKPTIRQFLQFAQAFVNQCGQWIDSPLLTIDPILRKSYEQMEYRPLVNARVGQLGRNREILNDRFLAQYEHLLRILSYRRQLDNDELMSVTYYLLLQDRVGDALGYFDRVNAEKLAMHIQYDYCSAYLDFSKGEPKAAKAIAAKYADYPVDRWRNLFANIVNQANEIDSRETKVADKEDRNQVQSGQAANTPEFDFTVESKKVKINYHNLKQVQVNYYLMDIELLFSGSPFVQGESKQFANIQPNQTQTVALPEKDSNFEFALPEKLLNSNVLVEIVGAGTTHSQAYYSNALRVRMIENYGELRVSKEKDDSPLPKVYCKVYARMKDGSVKFYKDGYTDLRGRFDYTSLSTNELDFVDRFSVLILSEDLGAMVREASPPKR